ncbi:BofC C-terminal domain-containing protein [Neobacillus mesonae]|nr:BofC C-terminal domain-containing protein [Neobacillus mesonae]
MNFFRPKNKDRKSLRRLKRTFGTLTFCLLLAAITAGGIPISKTLQSLLTMPESVQQVIKNEFDVVDEIDPSQEVLIKELEVSDQLREVFLEKNYICGVETITLGMFNQDDMILLIKQHPEWSGRLENDRLVLNEHVNDLSPDCRSNAFMGMDTNGNLALYEGEPDEEKVIRTFFQLDIGTMETSLPEGVLEQLQKGIRIQDVDEYNSVLSTFSDYAVAPVGNIVR